MNIEVPSDNKVMRKSSDIRDEGLKIFKKVRERRFNPRFRRRSRWTIDVKNRELAFRKFKSNI
jgi:hypothetical protein